MSPVAVKLMHENARLNRVEGRIVPILGDAKTVVAKRLQSVADRVLMPLSEKALAYLNYALMALKPSGGWIHYYCFEHASKHEAPVEKAKMKAGRKLQELGVRFRFSGGRVVRSTGPNWYQVVLDIRVLSNSKIRQS